MKIRFDFVFFSTLLLAVPLMGQDHSSSPVPLASPGRDPVTAGRAGDYASDLAVVRDAQQQALAQAREMLGQAESPEIHRALESAIQEMEHASRLLEEARSSPEKLPAALSAQKDAYQSLLKIAPREFRISRSQSSGQSSAGQPNRRELDQLQMTDEENRYETERQARAAPNRQQNELARVADRLKELARRQQDLNDRLRELQTALSEARTDQQRQEIERQLKRLRDEERQMLSQMDDLRQDQAQSPDNSSSAQTRQQLDQTRSDMQRTSQELERQAVSQALAAGTRAQQGLDNLKEDVRRQTSGRFTQQMRDLRNQARELARREEEIARGLQSMTDSDHPSLDNSAQRQQLVQQLSGQQSGLTNLLAGMRSATEQAENSEPLVSKKLYDMLRRADQMHTDNLLETSRQLVDRGFLPQAGEAEQSARRNLNELRQGVEQAAEDLLGSETEALRFAQKELDDLARQVGGEINGRETNAPNRTGQTASTRSAIDTNGVAGADGRPAARDGQEADRHSERSSSAAGQTAAPEGREQNGSQGQTASGNNSAEAGNREGAAQTSPGGEPGGSAGAERSASTSSPDNTRDREGAAGRNRLNQWVQQLGNGGGDGGALTSGPIMGNNFVPWADRMRDVEDVVDAPDLRNQLATVRERVAGLRTEYRQHGRIPQADVVRSEILVPMAQVRVWLQEELARREDASSLVPLDRDPVPDKYSEQVRHYYEKLGSAQ